MGETTSYQYFDVTAKQNHSKDGGSSQMVEAQNTGTGITATVSNLDPKKTYTLTVFTYVEKGGVNISANDTKRSNSIPSSWLPVFFTIKNQTKVNLKVTSSEANSRFYVDDVVLTESLNPTPTAIQAKVTATPTARGGTGRGLSSDCPGCGGQQALLRLAKYYYLKNNPSAQASSPDYTPIETFPYTEIHPIIMLSQEHHNESDYFRDKFLPLTDWVKNFYSGRVNGMNLVFQPLTIYQANVPLYDLFSYSRTVYPPGQDNVLEVLYFPYLEYFRGTDALGYFNNDDGRIEITALGTPGYAEKVGVFDYGSPGISAHEIGHAMGLEHSVWPSIMRTSAGISTYELFDTDDWPEKFVACNSSLNRGSKNCWGYKYGYLNQRHMIDINFGARLVCMPNENLFEKHQVVAGLSLFDVNFGVFDIENLASNGYRFSTTTSVNLNSVYQFQLKDRHGNWILAPVFNPDYYIFRYSEIDGQLSLCERNGSWCGNIDDFPIPIFVLDQCYDLAGYYPPTPTFAPEPTLIPTHTPIPTPRLTIYPTRTPTRTPTPVPSCSFAASTGVKYTRRIDNNNIKIDFIYSATDNNGFEIQRRTGLDQSSTGTNAWRDFRTITSRAFTFSETDTTAVLLPQYSLNCYQYRIRPYKNTPANCRGTFANSAIVCGSVALPTASLTPTRRPTATPTRVTAPTSTPRPTPTAGPLPRPNLVGGKLGTNQHQVWIDNYSSIYPRGAVVKYIVNPPEWQHPDCGSAVWPTDGTLEVDCNSFIRARAFDSSCATSETGTYSATASCPAGPPPGQCNTQVCGDTCTSCMINNTQTDPPGFLNSYCQQNWETSCGQDQTDIINNWCSSGGQGRTNLCSSARNGACSFVCLSATPTPTPVPCKNISLTNVRVNVTQGINLAPSSNANVEWNYTGDLRPNAFKVISESSTDNVSWTQYSSYTESPLQRGLNLMNLAGNKYHRFKVQTIFDDSSVWDTVCPASQASKELKTNSVAVYDVQGTFGTAVGGSACKITGWARDQDVPLQPVDVHVYMDGIYGAGGRYLTAVTANIFGQDLASLWGLGDAKYGYHRFDITLEGAVRDNKPHQIYVYAINKPGTLGNTGLIWGNPKTIQCDPPLTFGQSLFNTSRTAIQIFRGVFNRL